MESLLHDLWAAQAELRADPTDLAAWHRLARGLLAAGDRSAGVRALGELGQAAAHAGYLPLALLAVKDLEPVDVGAAQALGAELARLYARGSNRIDPAFQVRPPAAPQAGNPSPMPEQEAVLDGARRALVTAAAAGRRARTGAVLPAHPIFSALPEPLFAELVALLTPRALEAGAVVFEQGEPGAALFIVARGTLRVERDGKTLAILRAGALVGEMALLSAQPRSARLVCETPAVLLALERSRLDELGSRYPELPEVLAEHCRRRLLENLTASSPLFAPLPPEQRVAVIGQFETRRGAAGERLIREGEAGEGLHVILMGSAQVEASDGREQLALAELGPGDVFGEIALVREKSATATVTAKSPLVTLFLSREAFETLAASHPALVGAAFALATARERHTALLLEARPTPADDCLL